MSSASNSEIATPGQQVHLAVQINGPEKSDIQEQVRASPATNHPARWRDHVRNHVILMRGCFEWRSSPF